jgi:hypothetical protein
MEWVKRSGQGNVELCKLTGRRVRGIRRRNLKYGHGAGAGILVAKQVNTRGMGRARRTL